MGKETMMIEVNRNSERSRYEIIVDGVVTGVADYRDDGDAVVLPHTEIDASMRGQGLGETLVRGALDDIRRARRTVVPDCWFVAQFIDEHPEYRDLVRVP
jgi:predicted GNAT family acetyltransferase